MSKNYKIGEMFKSGVVTNNPVFVQLLGMCPTLATSTSVENGLGMGVSAMVVLIASNVVISLLRKIIPKKIRIAAYIVIIAGFVTMIDLLLKAYVPALSKSLGLFIPLIVVNCMILGRAEAFASKNTIGASFFDGLTMGLGFTFALFILGTIREVFGAGTFLGMPVFGPDFQPASMIGMAPGGFLVLGIVIAAIQLITRKRKEKKEGNA